MDDQEEMRREPSGDALAGLFGGLMMAVGLCVLWGLVGAVVIKIALFFLTVL